MNWFLYDNGPRNEMVKSIKRNKALGIDALMQVLHVYLMFMNKLNTNCLFLFIEKEVFSLFKIAKTFPIFKSSDASDVSYYRAISVLPIFSKVLQRITYNRFFDYLHGNKLFLKGDVRLK